jgi:hypothetical protein
MGYARGKCANFPGGQGNDVADAVRFGILRREGGKATIQFVMERDHHPFDSGTLEVEESAAGGGTVLARQARAFLASYLRRNV